MVGTVVQETDKRKNRRTEKGDGSLQLFYQHAANTWKLDFLAIPMSPLIGN